MEEYKKIENSIITTYRKTIWRKVVHAVEQYDLIKEGDCIAVCVSGGKDSMLLAKCMQELASHGKVPFKTIFITMDPGYNKENRSLIEANAQKLNIPLQFFEAPIFGYVKEQETSPCYICAKMRRGYLYSYAQKLGCNKIALGHHFDDVIETTIMGMFYSSEISFMRPKLQSKNFPDIELIRPLYQVKEKDIINWKKYHNLEFIACACPLLEKANVKTSSKRQVVKDIIKKLRIDNPEIDDSIFRSIHNVNLDTIVGYRDDETLHEFNQIYQKRSD